jgi:predicted transcriptional regulator
MGTEDNLRRATLYCACPRCLERAARELRRQGLRSGEIAAALGLSQAAVEAFLIDESKTEL